MECDIGEIQIGSGRELYVVIWIPVGLSSGCHHDVNNAVVCKTSPSLFFNHDDTSPVLSACPLISVGQRGVY